MHPVLQRVHALRRMLSGLLVAAITFGCAREQGSPPPPAGPQAPPPRPTPDDRPPRAVPGDASTPEAAAAELLRAIDNGDQAAVRAALYAPTPREAVLADALAPLLVSARRLEQATARRLGPDAAGRLGGPVAAVRALAPLAASPWLVQGEVALLPPHSRKMVRAGGRWRLVVPGADQPEDAAKRTADRWQRQARATARTAAELDSGRYKSEAELVQTFNQRMSDAPAAE